VNDHVINALISLAFFTLAALLLWVLVRMNVRERMRRDAADDRARKLAQEQLDSGSAFGIGAANALMGGEFWENPHCTPTGSVVDSRGWHAGWCYGHRQLREVWRAKS
jgi:hypothetical protein